MNRSRYPGPTSYASRSYGGIPDVAEENRTLDLFLKFRGFRSFLKSRLKKIHEEDRLRELADEVDDIKYFLTVMSDMSADENHGAEALQGFIDRIHEMVRTNPMDERTPVEDSPEEYGEPRSPSPTDFSEDFVRPVRIIPVERDETRDDRNVGYFERMEVSIENSIREPRGHSSSSSRYQPSTRSPWELNEESFTRRPTRDVDMRVPSIGVRESSSWRNRGDDYEYNRSSSSSSSSFSTPFDSMFERRPPPQPRQIPTEQMYERRPARSYNDDASPRVTSTNDRGAVQIDYNHGSPPVNWNTMRSNAGGVNDIEPDLLQFSQPFQSQSNRSSFVNQQQQQLYPNQNMNFNHSNLNRFAQGGSMPGVAGTSPFVAAQSNINVASGFPRGSHQSAPQPQSHQRFAANVNAGGAGGPARLGVVRPQQRVPLLPTPPVPLISNNNSSTNADISTSSFANSGDPRSNAQSYRIRTQQQESLTSFSSSTEATVPRDREQNPPDPRNMTPEQMKEMFKLKAQQHFGRMSSSHKKDNQQAPTNQSQNQNVPPAPSVSGPQQKVQPPHRSPKESLLASNQIPSERDPRLQQRIHRMSGSSNEGNRDRHSEDPRVSKDKEREKDRNTSHRETGKQKDHHHRDRERSRDDRDKDKGSRSHSSSHHHRDNHHRDRDHHYRDERDKDKERVLRVNLDEPTSSNNKLEDARNRVKEKLNATSSNRHTGSKLSEIRKQMENERFHPLGRQNAGSKKQQASFDEAIVVPIQPPPARPHPKPKEKEKEKEIEHPSGSQKEKEMDKHKSKNKGKPREKSPQGHKKNAPKSSSRKSDSTAADVSPSKRQLPQRNAKSQKQGSKDVPSNSNAKDESQPSKPETEVPKAPVFRIPKIKKPDPPPPPPKSPSPSPRSPSPESEPELPDVQEPSPAPSSTSEEKKKEDDSAYEKAKQIITDDFIKRMIMGIQEEQVDSSAKNAMVSDQGLVEEFRKKLFQQLQGVLQKDKDGESSSVVEEQETIVDTGSEAGEIENDQGEGETEPGTHRSRSRTRGTKRGAKRRSSLEKLHDALKEMKFDAMLPLGPRRCTRAQSEGEGAEGGSEVSTHPDASEKQSANTLASSTTKKTKVGTPSPARKDKISAMKQPPGPKKGRKRKRPASKAKPNKKKKGPVTRAQVVKTALKINQKEKEPGTTGDADETPTDGPAQPKAPASTTKRVTRAAAKKQTAKRKKPKALKRLKNLFSVKIKSEPVIKEEPLDQSFEKATDDSSPEVVNEDGDTIDSAASNPVPSPPLRRTSTTIVHGDVDGMSIDIKDEPEFNEREESMDVEFQPEPTEDTNYDQDFIDSLPNIPTIESVYSLRDNENEEDEYDGERERTFSNILNQFEIEDSEEIYSGEDVHAECQEALDGIVTAIEDQEENEMEETNNAHEIGKNLSRSNRISTMHFSSDDDYDDDDEEPNDFIEIPDSPESQPKSDHEMTDKVPRRRPSGLVSHENEAIGVDQPMVKEIKEEIKSEPMDIPEWQEQAGVKPIPMPQVEEEPEDFENPAKIRIKLPDPPVARLPDDPAPEKKVTNLRGRKLYKCRQCSEPYTNANDFKDHVASCPSAEDYKTFGCPHCNKRVKSVIHLLEHMKNHGLQKQICGLCPFKTWIPAELTRHLKTHHKVYNHKVEKLEYTDDPEEDPAFIAFPKEVYSRISTVHQLKERYACYADRLVFEPEDAEKVPKRQIFQTQAYCSKCSYSSKVRVNFLRHLDAHKMAEEKPDISIPVSDPVNPVPCLERKELMFDKMLNWAHSTLESKQNATNDNASVPQFVSEQFRYVCPVAGCEQITVDEHMLRTHIKTLHSNEDSYKCPHCQKHEGTKNDPRNTVPIDRLAAHLRLHGPKLYRCAYCDVIHTQVTMMEKHLPEKHPERKPIHFLVRNLDSEGNPAHRRNSTDESASSERWRCGLCATKQLFSSYLEVKNHCCQTHRVLSQFSCCQCRYATDDDERIASHVLTGTCNKGGDESQMHGKISVMWYRNEFELKQEDTLRGPIWKRSNAGGIKHIRGIFLEDVKEKVPRLSEKQEKKQMSSTEKIVAPSGGKTQRRPYKPPLVVVIPSVSTGMKPSLDEGSRRSSTDSTNSGKVFTCPKCKLFRTQEMEKMRVHIYNEFDYKRYKCKKCSRKYVTESSLKGHLEIDHLDTLHEIGFELDPEDPIIEQTVNKFFASELESVEPPNEPKQASRKEIKTPTSTPSSSANSSPVKGMGGTGEIYTCKHCFQGCQTPHNLRFHVLAKHLSTDRFACNYCNATFSNLKVAKGHSVKTHKDQPLSIQEKYTLNLTPEFWLEEYGINIRGRRDRSSKKSSIASTADDDSLAETDTEPRTPSVTSCADEIVNTSRDPDKIPELIDLVDEEENDMLFDLDNIGDNIVPMIDDQSLDIPLATAIHNSINDATRNINNDSMKNNLNSSTGGGEPVSPSFLVQQYLFEDNNVTPSAGTAAAGVSNKSQVLYAYQCFHCGENTLSVRGARGHWERRHSRNRDERCNYYEYKAINDHDQLPPCVQLTCSYCEFVVASLNVLQSHYQLYHPDVQFKLKRKLRVGTMSYECNICYNECSTMEDMNNHLDNSHSQLLGPKKNYIIINDLAKRQLRGEIPDFYGKLVEDRVHYVCEDPICAEQFNNQAECQTHMGTVHEVSGRKGLMKYQRFVINERVKVPPVLEVSQPSVLYKCPKCSYSIEDRANLVTHLGKHVHTYRCPTCKISFEHHIDTKIHIRLEHGDPLSIPAINDQMLLLRANLEKDIMEIHGFVGFREGSESGGSSRRPSIH